MYRKMVISSSANTNSAIAVRYNVHGAVLLYQNMEVHGTFNSNFSTVRIGGAVIFDDAVKVSTTAPIGGNTQYSFIFDVAGNQPAEESVKEITANGVGIIVYNENGAIVCHNGVGVSGEMTSEPIVGPGEMTSEPVDGPGEMTSEPIDGPGTMI